jgi:tetratricopeptide (TPR) repeat protein
MDFLKNYLPGPVVDIFLPLIALLLFGVIAVPKIIARLKETGVWDRLLDKVGGEKLRLMQFEREISRLQKSGDVVAAARLYEEAEWYPEAIKLYVDAEDYVSAAALYEQLEQWERAAEMYFKADDWKRAAKMLSTVGKHAEAAKYYEDHGQKIDAAKLYYDAGNFERAAALYEDVSYFPQAGKSYEQLGEYVKAAENYEQHWSAATSVSGGGLISSPSDREAKIALHAGRLYEKGGAPERAAELYKRAGLSQQAADLAAKEGRFKEAGEMLLKEEKLSEAATMFEKAGEAKRAALIRGEIAFNQGDNATAADHFLKGGDNLRAAELYESGGNLEGAARCYEESDAPLQAGGVYLRAGHKERAAIMFERGHDFEQAAKLYEDVQNIGKASELYEQCGRFFEAGKLADELGQTDRAIQLLQQVDTAREEHESSTLILSRLFLGKNMPALAVDKLERLLAGKQIGGQTLPHYYCLGLAYEALGRSKDAIETYRKVMTERYGYEDVETRIERLQSSPAVPSQTPAPATATPPPPPPPPRPPQGQGQAQAQAQVQAQARAQAPPPSTAPRPPKKGSSPIQIVQPLGEGLLGKTFKGLDTRSQSAVTVKLLRNDLLSDQSTVQAFLGEAKLARGLEHPSLVRLLGLIQVDGHRAAVTEYVDGFSLSEFLSRNKRISVKQALDLLVNLSTALDYAHGKGLLHRDLKLTNVLVSKGGKLRVTGFGLGALRTPALGRADGYPSPEFLAGTTSDRRSDLYSLAAMIYHALTGQAPQPGATGEVPSLRATLPDIPGALEHILGRLLAADANQRFSTASEIIDAARSVTVAS